MTTAALPVRLSLITTNGKAVEASMTVKLSLSLDLSFQAGGMVTYDRLYAAIKSRIMETVAETDPVYLIDSLEVNEVKEMT